MSELERRIIEAARRWYRSTNEAELAEAVQEYERELHGRVAVEATQTEIDYR